MKSFFTIWLLLIFAFMASSCATTREMYQGLSYEGKIEKGTVLRGITLSPDVEDKILSMDPERITEKEIREVLSLAPAPRIINIHGGIYPIYLLMKSFSEFLTGMGYPEQKIRNPGDGSYSYSCYKNSEELAGIVAWYFEKEGMRPILIGHSQGGIQTVKVLHELAGTFSKKIQVWNPITESGEDRYAILDPLNGAERPVVGLNVSYATAVGAGGFTRFLPNQWSMLDKLRTIPDSAEEFTGFYMGLDLLGGDLMGFASTNKYEAKGKAKVRNVRLPMGYRHVFVPRTKHLAKSQEIRDWINSYTPTEEPELKVKFASPSDNIIWAADVWHSIKKHWVIELQRLIQARRSIANEIPFKQKESADRR